MGQCGRRPRLGAETSPGMKSVGLKTPVKPEPFSISLVVTGIHPFLIYPDPHTVLKHGHLVPGGQCSTLHTSNPPYLGSHTRGRARPSRPRDHRSKGAVHTGQCESSLLNPTTATTSNLIHSIVKQTRTSITSYSSPASLWLALSQLCAVSLSCAVHLLGSSQGASLAPMRELMDKYQR